MSPNLEGFRPKLRPGRVIPQGSRIIFETDNPYNQIVLPMALADLVLLCSGKFSVGEIVEKIYKKQGAVPFKSILKTIHVLHQGGFFENGSELTLNTHLRSWMEPRHSRFRLAWRFGQRIVADRRSPGAYYAVTLALMICALLGLQSFPTFPLNALDNWLEVETLGSFVFKMLICSSLVQTVRHLLRGIQLLLLTGKAYNVSLQLSIWGVHLNVGDEANDLFENKLYTAMFHVSQILMGWGCVFFMGPYLSSEWLDALIFLNSILTLWEINPFVNSEGLKLVQSMLLTSDREIVPWHFETSSLIKSLNTDSLRSDQDFARICAVWGTSWAVGSFVILEQIAVVFGPRTLTRVAQLDVDSLVPMVALGLWLTILYFLVQAFIESIITSVVQTRWRGIQGKVRQITARSIVKYDLHQLTRLIQDLPLFSHFHDNNLHRILDQSEVVEFAPNSFILIQGDASRDLYVLLEGEVEISRQTGNSRDWLIELAAPSIFGEAALLGDSPRGAQVVAKTVVAVLKVPVLAIRQIAEESQTVRHLEDFRNAILVNQFFASSPVFRSLSTQSIEFLCSRGSLEYFDLAQMIFNQGDTGDSIYLILRGSVDVEVHGTHVKRLGQGNFFGEIALIANIPRTAKIVTFEPSVFFKISAESFWEVLVQHMDLGVFIETVSESRLREDLEIATLLRRNGTDG